MNHPFLKIAGVDSLDKFYEMFPDEATFMAKYGKQVKKLLNGDAVKKAQKGYEFDLNGNFKVSPAPLEMETYDFAGNQKAIDKAANKVRRQNLRQGVGLDNQEGLMDESIQKPNFIQNLYNEVSDFDPDNVKKAVNATGTINQNITKVSDAIATKKWAKNQNKMLKELSPLIAQAQSSMPEMKERNYLRDDDPSRFIQPDTLHNPLGSGQGLYAKNGAEIANTFAPNTIYTDLEKAQTGAEMALITEGINMAGDQAAWLLSRNTKKFQKENEKMMSQMGMQPSLKGIQSPYVSHMEHGGFVNPQVATSLEGVPIKKLFAPDPTMDTLRTGGNIRQNTMAMGGNLRTHWGGGLKDLSYNPFGGPTVKAVGNSHDESDEYGRTGIGLSVGDTGNSPLQDYAEFGTKVATDKAVVEVEPEPIIMKENPDGSESAVVFGALKFPKFIAKAIDKPEWSNKSFKEIVENDIVKKENKLEKQQSKALELLKSDDLLTKKTGEVTFDGAMYGFRTALDDKKFLADFQDAMNKADEAGFDIHKFEKTGKLTKAKMGAKITTAQKGITKDQMSEFEKLKKSGNTKALQEYMYQIAPDIIDNIIKENKLPRAGVWADDQFGFRTKLAEDQIRERFSSNPITGDVTNGMRPGATNFINQYASDKFQLNGIQPIDYSSDITFKGESENSDKKVDWFDIGRDVYNQVRPFTLPSNAEGLDLGQIAPELVALAQNQVDPVQAQKLPLRLMPMRNISLDKERADMMSDLRATQRFGQYNPALAATLGSEKYKANRAISDAEFKANQDAFMNTLGYNLEAMNKNDLANMQILDQQYVRQQQALSNTKAVQQAALNSINAKILENRNLNKALQAYENLYNFRFDKKGRAYNVNPIAEFNLQGSGTPTTPFAGMDPDELELYAKQLKIQQKKQEQASKNSTSKRNGGIVQAMKGLSLKDYK